MGQISAEVAQQMVDANGVDWARNFILRGNDTLPPNFDQIVPTPGSKADLAAKAPAPQQTSALTPAPAQTSTPVTDTATEGDGGLSVGELTKLVMQQQQAEAAQMKARFEKATADLTKQKSGPSVSERLFQLSAALAAPVPVRGGRFNGVMGNVMPVLAKQTAAARAGKIADADKRQALLDKYDEARMANTGKTMGYQLDLAKLRDAQLKAKQPKVVTHPVTGEPLLQPTYEGIAKPQSDAEVGRLPLGTPYIAWTGPSAGQIVTKLTP